MRRLDIFGHIFFVEHTADGWAIRYPGVEGKQGPHLGLPIPAFIDDEDALANYLADLCHEWATPEHPDVRWIE